MPTGKVTTKGDQGIKGTGAKLGTIEESEDKEIYYFDNHRNFDVGRDVSWSKSVQLGSYLIALNVK